MVREFTLKEFSTVLEGFFREPLFSDIWIVAEIASVSTPVSGHWYFSLKDDTVTLRANCWRTANRRLTLPDVGDRVRLHGRIDFYAARGEVQFIIDDIVAEGVGLAHAEFERLARKYAGMSKQRPLPRLPQRIGVVTSRSGAAWQDVIATLQTRFPCVEVVLAHSSVQGDNAPSELVAALELIYTQPVDVILLVRGGGSYEDLVAFNHEDVIQAILRSPVPIVSGVGHEVDTTIADLVADRRAATPTMAAMDATPAITDLVQLVANLDYTLSFHMQNRLNERTQRLDDSQARLLRAAPAQRVALYQQRIDYALQRSHLSVQQRLQSLRDTLTHQQSRLDALNPHAVLQRGFAVVRDAHGQIVRQRATVAPHDIVTIQLHDGQLTARITEES